MIINPSKHYTFQVFLLVCFTWFIVKWKKKIKNCRGPLGQFQSFEKLALQDSSNDVFLINILYHTCNNLDGMGKAALTSSAKFELLSRCYFESGLKAYFFFFNSSNRRVRSSKSTSSPPADVDPGGSGSVLFGTAGKSGKLSMGFDTCSII